MSKRTTTDAFSQSKFIEIIKSGKTDSELIVGDIIHLNHDLYDIFVVIDINHDGTTNTVDIMPMKQVGCVKFNNNGNGNRYKNSAIRNWINGPYIKLFDPEIQDIIGDISVNSNNEVWFDKAKILSATEVGLAESINAKKYSTLDNEGTKYSIFEFKKESKWDTKWIPEGDYGDCHGYWLRSRFGASYIWYVTSSGTCTGSIYTSTYGILPVLRF